MCYVIPAAIYFREPNHFKFTNNSVEVDLQPTI
jgi:hypothetical protein